MKCSRLSRNTSTLMGGGDDTGQTVHNAQPLKKETQRISQDPIAAAGVGSPEYM